MNRQQRRAQAHEQHAYVKQFSDALEPLAPEQFPNVEPKPMRAWLSRKYLVQLYAENNASFPDVMRLSICRATLGTNGRWQADITWDELQAIKHEIGLGNHYAVEVYPRDSDVVNVSNMRHLWVFLTPLNIGWFSGR